VTFIETTTNTWESKLKTAVDADGRTVGLPKFKGTLAELITTAITDGNGAYDTGEYAAEARRLGITAETLGLVTGIDVETAEYLYSGEYDRDVERGKYRYVNPDGEEVAVDVNSELFRQHGAVLLCAARLAECARFGDADEKLRFSIEYYLTERYKISLETIAQYAADYSPDNPSEAAEKIRKFLKSPDALTPEEKYNLSTTVTLLLTNLQTSN
jgi:hypothetical protein